MSFFVVISSSEGRGHATEAYEQGLLFSISGPQLVTGNPQQGEGCACQVFESSSSCPSVPYRSRNPPRLPRALSAAQREKIFFGSNVALRLTCGGEDSSDASSLKTNWVKLETARKLNESWLINYGPLIDALQPSIEKSHFRNMLDGLKKCLLLVIK